jgi:hypothetical protein
MIMMKMGEKKVGKLEDDVLFRRVCKKMSGKRFNSFSYQLSIGGGVNQT